MNSIGQLLLIGISGTELLDEEKKFLETHDIGGVILFRRNLVNEEQVSKLCQQIKSLSLSQTPIISIDMEGGRVHRLPKDSFKNFPCMQEVSTWPPDEIENIGLQLGQYLMKLGINLNFSPCLDILTNEKNILIGDRAFGTTATKVIENASPFITGLQKSEIAFCGKHFPGHGDTLIDSHLALPKESIARETLYSRELKPFLRCAPELPMLMTAHMIQESLDPELPITLSTKALPNLLEDMKKAGFNGLVISDDMEMKAISDHFGEQAALEYALNAGCHLVMYCNDLTAPERAIKNLLSWSEAQHESAQNKILSIDRWKKKFLKS